MAEEVRLQLLGRGTYGPERLPRMKGPNHLWNHVSMPPAQNSVIVYKDGTVEEGAYFPPWKQAGENVHLFIYGGANIHCDELDDFARDALIAAGYTCGVGVTMDVYMERYTDEYPTAPFTTGDDPVAARARFRAARIAQLEAELAALRSEP